MAAGSRLPRAAAPPPGGLTVALAAGTRSLAREWDELADRASAPPWVRPGWVVAWRRAFGRGALEVLVARQAGRLAGVLPLERRGSAWRSPTNPHTPGFGLLAEDDAARRALAAALVGQRPRAIDLRYLSPAGAGLEEMRAAARAAGYLLLARPLMRSPFVPVDGDWAAYERALDAGRRRELRRRRRLLERQGRLWLDVQDGRERLDALLEEGFGVEGSGWKTAAGTAIASQPATRAFYEDVAGWAAGRGALRLAFLRLDDRPLAFDYCLEEGGAHYLVKTGYHPAWRRYGPGMLLRYEMLARAFRLPLATYEFLGADEAWKLGWADQARERVWLQAFAPSLPGLAGWAARAYGRPASRRLRAWRSR